MTALVLVAGAVSCGGAPSKTGGGLATLTLQTTSTLAPNDPGGDVLEAIKAELSTLSNGAITAVDGGLAGGATSTDNDGDAIRLVTEGTADLAVVRTAAFSAAGLHSFAALQAPFLIEAQKVADAVAADPVAAEMLDTLGTIGLVGLAIAPSGLRHPFGWGKPLLGPSDYAGATINTRPGVEVDELFHALGATTDHSVAEVRSRAATAGTLRGVEVSLQQHFSTGPPLIMATNVVLYSKFDVVIMNRKFYDGLSSAQRDVIRAAVSAAVADAPHARQSEAAAFIAWCHETGNVAVVAGAADLAGLRQAFLPMINDLQRDPSTKRAIARIRELAAGAQPTDLGTCTGPKPTTPTPTPTDDTAATDQSAIDGTWRNDTTLEDLVSVGVPPAEAEKDVGVKTWVFQNGRLNGTTKTIPCRGSYRLDGNRISWAFDPDSCGGSFTATFTVTGDHMTFVADTSAADGLFFSGYFKGGFTRIGGAP